MFTKRGIETFFTSQYQVSPASDRMGYRLEGPIIEQKNGSDIISDGIPLGGIQVTSDGSPIILMADRQPTGGYAKIGTVISYDLPKIAQSTPGDILQFEVVSKEEAQKEGKEKGKKKESLDKFV